MQNAPVTLADLIRYHQTLWVCCRDCHHERDIDPATLPLPPAFAVYEVGHHMICTECGSHEISTAPELFHGGTPRTRAKGTGDEEA